MSVLPLEQKYKSNISTSLLIKREREGKKIDRINIAEDEKQENVQSNEKKKEEIMAKKWPKRNA